MNFIIVLFSLFTMSFALSSDNVLVIGDSHTAGWFGQDLHRLLSKEFKSVATFGHSSSAPTHWMGRKEYKLRGGKFNALSINTLNYKDPSPVHWKEYVKVPKFSKVISNTVYHKAWKSKSKSKVEPDLVVIALGANDARSISNVNGRVNQYQVRERKVKIQNMLNQIENIGAKCIWIGPPNGLKKTKENQNALYDYLKMSIGNRCSFFSSNHYKVTGCDGYHFNCRSHREKARQWAKEVSKFIIKNRNGNEFY